MIINKETVETIKYALNFLLDINKSIIRNSNSKVRLQRAIDDVEKDCNALNDFDRFLGDFGSGKTEDGRDVYFYL